MAGMLAALYSAIVYLFFLGTFLYAIGFVQELVVPKSINSGAVGSPGWAIAINLALLGLFAAQHSVMARPGFKRVWTRVVPHAAERSTYVLFASLALALLFWQWRPLPYSIWSVDDVGIAAVITGLAWLGWTTVLVSTFLVSHFHLFGLSQGFSRVLGLDEVEPRFVTPFLYRVMRHPIYAGFIVAFWATPETTLGHLLFAAATTGYIFVGIHFEERDLIGQFGDRYQAYRSSVGMLMPRLRGRSGPKRRAAG
jgi:methanethiol S-methyltransferase